MKSVQLFVKGNVVEFNIQNVDGHMPMENENSKDNVIKGGIWYVASLMTGYVYFINENGGEGESEMYKRVGPL